MQAGYPSTKAKSPQRLLIGKADCGFRLEGAVTISLTYSGNRAGEDGEIEEI